MKTSGWAAGSGSGVGSPAQRWFMGVVGLVSGAALAFAATVLEAPWWSRVIVFFPLWLGGVGLLRRGRPEDFRQTNRRAIYLAGTLTAVLLLLAL